MLIQEGEEGNPAFQRKNELNLRKAVLGCKSMVKPTIIFIRNNLFL